MASTTIRTDLKCFASTGRDFCRSIQECDTVGTRERGRDAGSESNLFREAQFAPDTSCIVTQNEDHALRTFPLPTRLTQDETDPWPLKPYAQYQSPSNIQSFAVNPLFDVQNLATTVVLCASADVPLSLRNALDYSVVHATYPFVDGNTERHLSAGGLFILPSGTNFVAGTYSAIGIFDCSRDGSGPVVVHNLRPSARPMRSWQMRKGMVKAMSANVDQILAIGTTAGDIGLFDGNGLHQCETTFRANSGTGISTLKWSACGRYLFVAERRSDSIMIFDIRGAGEAVATLQGRCANTNQILRFDLKTTSQGTEVFAGGTDGVVRAWSNPAGKAGNIEPDHSWNLHEAPVSSAIWDNSGAYLATCSGERHPAPDFSEEDGGDEVDNPPRSIDNTLKLWRFEDALPKP